jgi:hypothetical protein
MSTDASQVGVALFLCFNIFFLSFYLSRFSFYINMEERNLSKYDPECLMIYDLYYFTV